MYAAENKLGFKLTVGCQPTPETEKPLLVFIYSETNCTEQHCCFSSVFCLRFIFIFLVKLCCSSYLIMQLLRRTTALLGAISHAVHEHTRLVH